MLFKKPKTSFIHSFTLSFGSYLRRRHNYYLISCCTPILKRTVLLSLLSLLNVKPDKGSAIILPWVNKKVSQHEFIELGSGVFE
jgi:hypothetical protein